MIRRIQEKQHRFWWNSLCYTTSSWQEVVTAQTKSQWHMQILLLWPLHKPADMVEIKVGEINTVMCSVQRQKWERQFQCIITFVYHRRPLVQNQLMTLWNLVFISSYKKMEEGYWLRRDSRWEQEEPFRDQHLLEQEVCVEILELSKLFLVTSRCINQWHYLDL